MSLIINSWFYIIYVVTHDIQTIPDILPDGRAVLWQQQELLIPSVVDPAGHLYRQAVLTQNQQPQ